ncbi:DUF11 domain-containing protein [Scytonema sp. UIC 10036]|uniref:isopeptide-forming domain-containing fimbrial protein n=1 Tax=Scytonema sp. UIC 10036 TaxID=2304196 RepID=UPI0012DA1DDD|nr:isopeptide-forming domain-containing fimbrial protein [Scytonema sp. UIC 10036]MUG97481.1 DUF11 domain-containing protein [Scytonema sp. UIC 10036]
MKKLSLLFSFSLLYALCSGIQPAQAEGSKELISGGGHRPYLEWSPNLTTANITRKTLLKVYVQAGETVNLGSSVHTSDPSFNGQDIVYRSPSGQKGSCDVQSTGFGFIDTLAKEQAGPLPNAGGYTPCSFVANETGVYEVEFHAPELGSDQRNPPSKATNADFPTDATQTSTVSAWDITVRDSQGNVKLGRVFTNYLAFNLGTNGLSLNSDFFIQTKDGYLYRTAMNGVDPFGFIFFANSRGYKDGDSTLYRSTRAAGNTLAPFLGDVQVQRPDVLDTLTDMTHLVFINKPDVATLTSLGIPSAPLIPPKPTNFKFTGKNGASGNQTFVGAGGHFSFDSSSLGSYEIILDTDNNGIYDPSVDRVLQNVSLPGKSVVLWDGKDAQGNNLLPRPANAPYNARIRLRAGEYHFPMLDAENNPSGFVIEMMNAPGPFPPGINKFTVYYNDDNYKTKDGTDVDLNGPGNPTNPRNAAVGIDSTSGQHEFSGGYGDFKGIDTWTFYPGEAVFTDLIITTENQANVQGTKSVRFLTDTDGSGTVTVGDRVQYTITYSNLAPGKSDATNFVISDSLPAQLTFVSAEITSQTSGNDITLNSAYNGSGALTNSGTLRVGDTITITVTATINNHNNGNPISNQASASFKTPDSTATTGTVFTDANSAGATTNPPSVGNPFPQNSDDTVETGNDPTKTGDDDPTLLTVVPTVSKPNILLVKRITAINGSTTSKGGDNLGGYINEAANPYDDNDIEPNLAPKPPQYPTADTNVWPNPSSFLLGGINGGNVSPNNELEYTIYFLSAGTSPAPKVLLCDRVPDNTTFIPTAFNNVSSAPGGVAGADRGILLYQNGSPVSLTDIQDGDVGQYFPPGVDPKTVYPKIECGGANTNGAIVVNLGDVPNATSSGTPPSSFGYIRFRGKVK